MKREIYFLVFLAFATACLSETTNAGLGGSAQPNSAVTQNQAGELEASKIPASITQIPAPIPTQTLNSTISEDVDTYLSPSGKWHVTLTVMWGPQTSEWTTAYSYMYQVSSANGETIYPLLQDHSATFMSTGSFPEVIFWSPDEERMYFAVSGYHSTFAFNSYGPLYVVDLTTGIVNEFPSNTLGPYGISPDERFLAYVGFDGEHQYIEAFELKTNTLTGSTRMGGEIGHIVWSADSAYFAFTSVTGPTADADETYHIWVFEPVHLKLVAERSFTEGTVTTSKWDGQTLTVWTYEEELEYFEIDLTSCSLNEISN